MVDEFIIIVETMNYETLESFPNANLFYNEFERYAMSDYKYIFTESEELENAKTRLQSYNLIYQTYFKRRFTDIIELKHYPAVFVIVGSEHKIFVNGRLNEKKIGNRLIIKDLDTDNIIVHKSMIDFLKAKSVQVEFEKIESTKDEYFLIQKLPQLVNSEEYLGCKEVRKVANGKYIQVQSDDRILISQDAIKEISEHKFLLTFYFIFNGERYPSTNSTILTSGNLAFEMNLLAQKNNGVENSIFVPLIE